MTPRTTVTARPIMARVLPTKAGGMPDEETLARLMLGEGAKNGIAPAGASNAKPTRTVHPLCGRRLAIVHALTGSPKTRAELEVCFAEMPTTSFRSVLSTLTVEGTIELTDDGCFTLTEQGKTLIAAVGKVDFRPLTIICLEAIRDGVNTPSALQKERGRSKKSIHTSLALLMENGRIKRVGVGRYEITAKGLAALGGQQ